MTQKDKYRICVCRRSMEFFHEFSESHGVWLPIRRERKVDRYGVEHIKHRAEFGEYVFVPKYKMPSLRRVVPEKFGFSPLSTVIVPSGPVHRNSGVPPRFHEEYTDEATLRATQIKLDEEFTGQPVQLETETVTERMFQKNDQIVIVDMPLFEGQLATVERCRGDGEIRVHLTRLDRFLNIDRRFLRLVEDPAPPV